MSTENQSQIAFEQVGLGGVLKQNRLVVPANQREYSWTEQQVNQLLQDFGKAISENDSGYFLGTIVSIPRLSGELEIVDGQQRLATTAILLAAIRNYLEGKDAILVESINNEFLTGIDRKQRARVPKLTLNSDDNELFSWMMTDSSGKNKPPASLDSHERLLAAGENAKKFVRKVVANYDEKDHGDILNQWVSFVENKALIVLLRVPNDANAYKMFETLNDRGLRVSQADLIKSYLFGKSADRIREVQAKWSYMRGALETLDEVDSTVTFLRYALIAIRGHLTTAEVYEAIQVLVKGEQQAVTVTGQLESLAGAYVATLNPESEKWNSYPDRARKAVEVFKLLDLKPLRPLALAISVKMEPKDAADCFQFLVSLGVRLLIASTTRSGSVEVPLAEAAQAVYSGQITGKKSLKEALAKTTPTDSQFKEAFSRFTVSSAKLARYYLRSLEMAAKSEPEPSFLPNDDRSIINLEHILPMKPETNWPQFDEGQVKLYSKRVGNLALLKASANSDLRSDGFEKKKIIYAASPYVLTSQIAEFEAWTPDAIQKRQDLLATIAVKAWPV